MPASPRFRVALSFTGEKRDFVRQVADILAGCLGRDRVLFDGYLTAELARPELDLYLGHLFREESELLVPFFSADYAAKRWCELEWRQMRDIILQGDGARIMPFRFDAAPIEGLLSIDGYVRIGTLSPAEVAALILKRLGVATAPVAPLGGTKVAIARLPQSGWEFYGRKAELALLDRAWAESGHTHVFELVAPGGAGKTAVVNRWLEGLKHDGWRGARRVYAWSFYSQVPCGDRQAPEDAFLAHALAWFDVTYAPALPAWDKALLLVDALNRERSLFILDGVEPLQHPPGPMGGQLRAPGLQALLCGLARGGHPGLCLVTTREMITDLEGNRQGPDNRTGTVVVRDLGNLKAADGARLLHHLGVRRAGAAAIAPDDGELRAASREVGGHALALTLLGRYLTLTAPEGVGDIRQRDRVGFSDTAVDESEPASRIMAAYEQWFEGGGEGGRRALAAVRLLGLFDRPVDARSLAALRGEPAIAGLTEPLVGLSEEEWHRTLNRLRACGLVFSDNSSPPRLDAHPLLRQHFARRLREDSPQAWQAAHRRLYEHLKASRPEFPETMAELQPLYSAVAHGCLAGLHQEACVTVYWRRVLRRDQHYSWKHFGSFGSELAALAYFFKRPWDLPNENLSPDCRAWVLNQAAIYLSSLGRIGEALQPAKLNFKLRQAQMGAAPRTGEDGGAVEERSERTAAPNELPPASTSNLAELDLDLGNVADAMRDAEEALAFARKTDDTFLLRAFLTTLGHSKHQAGRRAEARRDFQEAERRHAEVHKRHPKLVSTGGFRYCVLLLAEVERAAWRRFCTGEEGLRSHCLAICDEVKTRAEQTLEWAVETASALDVGLDHLTLARVAVYRVMLGEPVGLLAAARADIAVAMDRLGASGYQDYLARGLIVQAWLRSLMGDQVAAESDLAKAWRSAERSRMRLHMADVRLHRARLFRDRSELEKARTLITECGYWRRREELEDAERAAETWPQTRPGFRHPGGRTNHGLPVAPA